MSRFSCFYTPFLALSLIIHTSIWQSETCAQDQNITFRDEKLAAVVREALNLPIPDTPEALKQIPTNAR